MVGAFIAVGSAPMSVSAAAELSAPGAWVIVAPGDTTIPQVPIVVFHLAQRHLSLLVQTRPSSFSVSNRPLVLKARTPE